MGLVSFEPAEKSAGTFIRLSAELELSTMKVMGLVSFELTTAGCPCT
jgi:hypothetical protein